jgi:hypothetical protein
MPYKFDKVPINNPKLDKRVKLTEDDKKNIVADYETGVISINGLAKKYGVSKRTIQFTLFPERKEKAKQLYKERRKDGRYYDKDKHNEYMKNHREHKKELWNNGLLNESGEEN